MDIAATLANLGTLVPTHALLKAGISSYALTSAVTREDIIRVRQGWYALPDTGIEQVRSARVGGRLTCLSAARQLGLATRGSGLHVEVAGNAVRLRDPDNYRARLEQGATVHWRDAPSSGDQFCVAVIDALGTMATCLSPELTIAAVDSAIRLGLITRIEWMLRLAPMPRRLRRLLGMVDGKAASITESVVRFRLAMLGVAMRSQMHIAGVGDVDFLIGDALVIEVDGREYHTDEGQFENDRRRDARLTIRGYRVLRFSYRQVFNRWFEVRDAVLAAIARGDDRH